MEIKTLGLIVKEKDERARNLAAEVVRYSQDKGWEVLTTSMEENGLVRFYDYVQVVQPDNFYSYVDVILVLGGDGTILQAASYTKELLTRVVPVLGVNLGRIGYLSTIPPEDIFLELEGFKDQRIRLLSEKC